MGNDIRAWPFPVGLLVKVFHFLATLRWPEGAHDLGVGGVSHLELILYEKWAVSDWCSTRCCRIFGGLGVLFQCRLFLLVQALRYGVLAGLLTVDRLPGGLRRFIPCVTARKARFPF